MKKLPLLTIAFICLIATASANLIITPNPISIEVRVGEPEDFQLTLNNTFDFDINYDGATNYVDVDGDSNTVNFTGSGYAGGYFYLDQTGNSRTFNIIQSSTLVSDWLQINSTGNGGTICVTQNDGGTSTSC